MMNWTTIAVAVIALIGTIINGYFVYKGQKAKKKNSNNSGNPVAYVQTPNGRNFLCLHHGEEITKLQIKVAGVCKEMSEVRTDVRDLKKELVLIGDKLKELGKP